jgi:hypothetical protein
MSCLEAWRDPRDGRVRYYCLPREWVPAAGFQHPLGRWLAELRDQGLEPVRETIMSIGDARLGVFARHELDDGTMLGRDRQICRRRGNEIQCWPSRAEASRALGLGSSTIWWRCRYAVAVDGWRWFYPDSEGFDGPDESDDSEGRRDCEGDND